MASRSTVHRFVAEDKFSKTADKVARKAGIMSGKVGKGAKVLAVGAGAAAAGVAALGYAGLKAIKVAEEQTTADARLAQVMKSMGYDKNAKAASQLADDLEQVVAVDSAVIKGAQAKLATFDDIAKSTDLMGRTTRLAADLSAAGFGDMGSASVGLGKALQDPITGMALLSKQGSLTKDQQKEIADAFEKTGDKGAAQESILKALEKQVGGVAEATADSSVKMSLAMGEVTESVGKALAPAFDKLVPVVQKASDWFIQRLMPGLQDLGKKILPALSKWWGTIQKAIEDNRPGLEKLARILKEVGKVVVTKVIPGFLKFAGFITKHLIKAIAKLAEWAPKMATFFLKGLATIVRAFGSFYKVATGVLEGILTVAEKTLGWIPGIGDKIKDAKRSFSSFRDHSVAKIDGVAASLENAADKVAEWDRDAANAKTAKLKADINDLKAKTATARAKLKDPDLTKERKAKIKADIADLKAKTQDAKARLAGVKGKTVGVTVKVNFKRYGKDYYKLPSGKVVPLAKGGIVTRPTVALIGEAGPEAVVPLSGSNDPRKAATGVTININGGFATSDEIARTTYRALLDWQRATGRQILATA